MTKKTFKILDISLGWLVFLVAAVVYLMTLEPTVSFWDCGEFISSSNKMQVGHPPGAPFFMIIARIAALFASDVTQVAKMVNGVSAIASALTIMFLFWTVVYFAKKMCKVEENYSIGQTVAVLGAGLIGALAYTFSDTFWFSAVEAEVYGMSSFFTALVFWAILKWSEVEEKITSYRWLLLICLLTGISIGIHLLNLLTIPAIAFVVYFKNRENAKEWFKGIWGFILTTVLSLIAIAAIMWGIIPGVGIVASRFDLLFVNTFGLDFNSGLLCWIILTIIALALSIYVTQKSNNKILQIVVPSLALLLTGAPLFAGNWFLNLLILIAFVIAIVVMVRYKKQQMLNLIMSSVTCILIGYSCYAIIVVRSNSNPSMDQNNPQDAFSLLYYLNREQYGDRPLLYGKFYTETTPIKVTESDPIYARIGKKYVITGYKRDYTYKNNILFPRMFSEQNEGQYQHVKMYEKYGDVKRGKPTQANNLKFFWDYQMNWMYWRYFMWNFAGRQNDLKDNGGEITKLHGNWICGFKSIDNARLGDQDLLPESMKNNKAHNTYYFLPLILGLIGLGFQFLKDKNNGFVVLLLFVLTGIAIVVYLNQTPNQPRERDYAYAGSFYAFAIWIGLGVVGLYELLRKAKIPTAVAGIFATLICAPIPYLMGQQNWDDHDRSNRYVCLAWGRNYLETCDKNAVLFTNGDNDTFSVWYAQEVEGIRTDVKICCIPYFQSDWYITQMKSKYYDAEPMNLSYTAEQYAPSVRDFNEENPYTKKAGYFSLDSLLKYNRDDKSIIVQGKNKFYTYPSNKFYLKVNKEDVIKSGTVKEKDAHLIDTLIKIDLNRRGVQKNGLMILDLINNNNWQRPIYYTGGINTPDAVGFDKYFQNEGFAYRLVPIKSSGVRIDADILYENMMHKYTYGNIDKDILIDNTIDNSTKTARLRSNFGDLAYLLWQQKDTVRAMEVINRAMEVMPLKNFSADYFDLNFIQKCYIIGDTINADKMIIDCLEDASKILEVLSTFDKQDLIGDDYNLRFNLETVRFSLQIANGHKRTEITEKYETIYKNFLQIFKSKNVI